MRKAFLYNDFHFSYLHITVILQRFLPLKLIAPCVVEKTVFPLQGWNGGVVSITGMEKWGFKRDDSANYKQNVNTCHMAQKTMAFLL